MYLFIQFWIYRKPKIDCVHCNGEGGIDLEEDCLMCGGTGRWHYKMDHVLFKPETYRIKMNLVDLCANYPSELARSMVAYDEFGAHRDSLYVIRHGGMKNLRGANLAGTNLRDAELHDADLRLANFSMANLRFANFTKADVRGAVFDGADITYANFTGTVGINSVFPAVRISGCWVHMIDHGAYPMFHIGDFWGDYASAIDYVSAEFAKEKEVYIDAINTLNNSFRPLEMQ
ncbi:MAG: pentapeptide repeat-containing protein [Magnetococcales bacterium]|nr:pentapeptide repeat-containing protein [Magnetococcales bacterium]